MVKKKRKKYHIQYVIDKFEKLDFFVSGVLIIFGNLFCVLRNNTLWQLEINNIKKMLLTFTSLGISNYIILIIF